MRSFHEKRESVKALTSSWKGAAGAQGCCSMQGRKLQRCSITPWSICRRSTKSSAPAESCRIPSCCSQRQTKQGRDWEGRVPNSEQLQNEGCQYCTWLSSFQQHRTALAAGEGTQSLGVLDVRAQILTDLSAWWGSLAREEEELELQTIPGSQREFRLWQAHGFVLRWHRSHLWDVGLVLAATAGCGRWHPQTG